MGRRSHDRVADRPNLAPPRRARGAVRPLRVDSEHRTTLRTYGRYPQPTNAATHDGNRCTCRPELPRPPTRTQSTPGAGSEAPDAPPARRESPSRHLTGAECQVPGRGGVWVQPLRGGDSVSVESVSAVVTSSKEGGELHSLASCSAGVDSAGLGAT